MVSKEIIFPELRNKYLSEFLTKSLELEMDKRIDPKEFTKLFEKIK